MSPSKEQLREIVDAYQLDTIDEVDPGFEQLYDFVDAAIKMFLQSRETNGVILAVEDIKGVRSVLMAHVHLADAGLEAYAEISEAMKNGS